MEIDGKKIAEEIRNQLKTEILKLSESNIVPKIAIITLGPEASWETYVRQKIKAAGELGIKAVLINLENADEEKLIQTVSELDSDPAYHGIIVQRPISSSFNRDRVVNSISPVKDVDGFRPDSKFEVPVFLAVKRLVGEALLSLDIRRGWREFNFVVLGKGETAGGPVIAGLREMGIEPKIIDTKTNDRDEILRDADIVISCVGKQNLLRAENIKKGAILIGVGTHGEDQGLRGDYKVEDIEKIAAAYTPTPGGVGPVNLSYLFKNLIQAAQLQLLKVDISS